MDKRIEKLSKVFGEMVENYNNGDLWKNIPLGREGFDIMKALPYGIDGEVKDANEKAGLLSQMLGCMNELDTPRFCIEVRRYMRELGWTDNEALVKLEEYVAPGTDAVEWGKKYDRHLKFDPVEMTEEWEDNIYNVEKECDEKLKGESRGMGFCFNYWSMKRAVLAKYGIEWRSPQAMNPRVLFD